MKTLKTLIKTMCMLVFSTVVAIIVIVVLQMNYILPTDEITSPLARSEGFNFIPAEITYINEKTNKLGIKVRLDKFTSVITDVEFSDAEIQDLCWGTVFGKRIYCDKSIFVDIQIIDSFNFDRVFITYNGRVISKPDIAEGERLIYLIQNQKITKYTIFKIHMVEVYNSDPIEFDKKFENLKIKEEEMFKEVKNG